MCAGVRWYWRLYPQVFENPERMTEAKATRLKESMKEEFGSVFELCQYVLTESECPSLLLETLATLLGFINWIELDYVFESNLIDLLVGKFFLVADFRNATLKVLNEIVAIEHEAAIEKQLSMFEEVPTPPAATTPSPSHFVAWVVIDWCSNLLSLPSNYPRR